MLAKVESNTRILFWEIVAELGLQKSTAHGILAPHRFHTYHTRLIQE